MATGIPSHCSTDTPDELKRKTEVLHQCLAKLFQRLDMCPINAITMLMAVASEFSAELLKDAPNPEVATEMVNLHVLTYLAGVGLLTEERYGTLVDNIENVKVIIQRQP